MNSYTSYQTFVKPSWSPPAWVFGPVWTVLYAIIAVTFGTVFYKSYAGEVPWAVALPFALNLVFNFSYTWLQFGLKNYTLASVDIILVLGTLVWALVAVYPYLKWVALANIPYLLWVSFATVLQLTITVLNK
ncbi:MAG TPA: tryptophan-rich sensory protein [Candidatus Paceibacterota bacterium]|nr:MAG: TspO protein [Parcubacteria group bacterium 21-58-10]HQT82713.1 tryptophan-rich sensory protein [Candidatus Paceibacterota bacterium]